MKSRLLYSLIAVASWAASPRALGAAKVGLLVTDQSYFWREVERGARSAADMLQVELTVKTAPNTTGGIQAKLTAALIEQPMDVLILNPNPTFIDQSIPLISAAVNKGLLVVAIDSPMPSGLGKAFVGQDQGAMSQAAAELFISCISDGDEVAILRVPNVPSLTDREKTVLEALHAKRSKSAVRINIYASPSARVADQAEQAKVLLATYPNLKAVFTSYSAATLGMMQAMKDPKIDGHAKLVGFGVSISPEVVEAIDNGVLKGWVAQNPQEVGRQAVEAAVALVQGKDVPAKYVDFLVITAENVHDQKIQALLK